LLGYIKTREDNPKNKQAQSRLHTPDSVNDLRCWTSR